MSAPEMILQVAVPSPLRRIFDYRPPDKTLIKSLLPGVRVRVPFGRTQVVGILIGVSHQSEVAVERLKPVLEVLDSIPLLPADLMGLLQWASHYYHHPIGEVLATALPVLLRQGRAAELKGEPRWRLTDTGLATDPAALKRAPKQAVLMQRLNESSAGLMADQLDRLMEHWRPTMARLVAKGLVEVEQLPCLPPTSAEPEPAPVLNNDQSAAVEAVSAALGGYQAFLLDGITGSGKTEVYLKLTQQVLAAGRQVLVLVPEIGLAPQIVERFRQRFALPIAVLHSALTDHERLSAWLLASRGEAPIVIGTRSAVFTPLPAPGLIIVDEEHDPSFKQQEGFRYSARDIAVMRARSSDVPVVLGSATPALESLYNVQQGRYQVLRLTQRAADALPPRINLLDVRRQTMHGGIAAPLLKLMQDHLARDEQVLLFLNRRGYAPTMICHECGWVADCQRCDAHMILHRKRQRLCWHHCGAERPVVAQCPACGSIDLRTLGQGTEQVEHTLREQFPDTAILRIDRDSTRGKGNLQALLDAVHEGKRQILIGTQMLAKGHHFPRVTLVGILEAEQGLFSADFRAGERMAQMIMQVAGRAGRARHPGRVIIQSHHPEHPLLASLVNGDYRQFAEALLVERQQAQLPPHSAMALVRAEAVDEPPALAFLAQVRDLALAQAVAAVSVLGPVPAPMERRAGRFRAQLLLLSDTRQALHGLLDQLLPAVEGMKLARRVRWSLDVDPLDTY